MYTFKQIVGSFCFLLSLFIGLAFTASPFSFAEAQDHAVGFQVGHTWPAGTIGTNVDNSIVPGLFYEFSASEIFAVQGAWVRSRHTNTNLAIDSYSVSIKGNLGFYDRLTPYGTFGMGLYDVSKDYGVGQTASKLLFGINFGLGADLDLTETIFLGMNFSFHSMFSATGTLPSGSSVDLSGRWTGIFLRGGFRF